MSKTVLQIFKYPFLFLVMGAAYVILEILWRGYSHISMFFVAGICGTSIGFIHSVFPENTPLWPQLLLGAAVIIYMEFVSGCILNLRLGLDIWDYSGMPFNFYGQICLPFSIAWGLLSYFVILLNDYLRYWFFHEKKPRYYWSFHAAKNNRPSPSPGQQI